MYSDFDRYDRWMDENLPSLSERFKVLKGDVKGKGRICKREGGVELSGEREMDKEV